jgi:hypothetical protein
MKVYFCCLLLLNPLLPSRHLICVSGNITCRADFFNNAGWCSATLKKTLHVVIEQISCGNKGEVSLAAVDETHAKHIWGASILQKMKITQSCGSSEAKVGPTKWQNRSIPVLTAQIPSQLSALDPLKYCERHVVAMFVRRPAADVSVH